MRRNQNLEGFEYQVRRLDLVPRGFRGLLKAFEHGEMLCIVFQVSLGGLEGVKWKEGRLETGGFSCEEGRGWISGKGKKG